MARRALLFALALVLLAGCAVPVTRPVPPPRVEKPPALVLLPPERVPLFADDMDLASLERAVEKSLRYYDRAAGDGPRRMGEAMVTVRELRETLIALREILRRDEPDPLKQVRIREGFDVYQSTGGDGRNTVLFTGYFEPIISGSLVKTERDRYPVYRAPEDAVVVNLGRFAERYPYEQLIGRVRNGELIPYYSRNEIEELGALAGRGLEIAWVDDRIDLFFLHT